MLSLLFPGHIFKIWFRGMLTKIPMFFEINQKCLHTIFEKWKNFLEVRGTTFMYIIYYLRSFEQSMFWSTTQELKRDLPGFNKEIQKICWQAVTLDHAYEMNFCFLSISRCFVFLINARNLFKLWSEANILHFILTNKYNVNWRPWRAINFLFKLLQFQKKKKK